MHAMGEIKPENRYQTQPVYSGGWTVLDRVNGQTTGQFTTADEAAADAKRLNSPRGIPA